VSEAKSDVIGRLVALAERSTDGRVKIPADHGGPDSIRRLGIDSLAFLRLLESAEREFGFEWEDDIPSEALASFEAMADYVLRRTSVPSRSMEKP
jgi:acyl carrier protein